MQVNGMEGQQQQGDDEDMTAPMTFEDVEQEAAAKQRAFDSQQAKASTSGSTHEKGGAPCTMCQTTHAAVLQWWSKSL